jgi:hypothetical protein
LFQKLRLFVATRQCSNKFGIALAAPKSPLRDSFNPFGFLSRLGIAQASLALLSLLQKVRFGTTANSYLELRCKDTAFFDTADVFLKKFYQVFKFLIFNIFGYHFSAGRLPFGSRRPSKLIIKNLIIGQLVTNFAGFQLSKKGDQPRNGD